jgi:hypothetical protein
LEWAKLGERVICQFRLWQRLRIIAGWVVVERAL